MTILMHNLDPNAFRIGVTLGNGTECLVEKEFTKHSLLCSES